MSPLTRVGSGGSCSNRGPLASTFSHSVRMASLPIGHILADRNRITLAELSRHPIVCLPEGTGVRTVLDQACAASGFHLDVAVEASAPSAVADLAIRGLGVAVLSESMVADDGQLRALVIDDVETPAILALIWRKTKSPALRQFLVHARPAFTRSQPGT